MTDNHASGFRPSHFGALDACIHHQSKEAGPAVKRGNGTHIRIAEILSLFQKGLLPSVDLEPPEVKWAIGLVLEYIEQAWSIFAVELAIDILNEFGEPITHGTIDLVLEKNREYLIIDWKTGDKGDHELQLHGYGTAFMDSYPQAGDVRGVLAYVDLRETVAVHLSHSISSTKVLLLFDKWKEKERHPYVIGLQCDWCGLRGECPAWAKEATAAFDKLNYLAINPATGLPQGGNLAPTAVTGLKNDPERLDSFLVAWDRAKTLVEEDWALKEALKTHMQTGFKAEHHILVTRKVGGVKSIDPEQFLEKVAHHIGYMQAAPAIKVDADKADKVWREFYGYGPEAKFPVEITETEKSETQYIRAKGKPGAGEARKKRKELE